jgi:PTH1 family peptidyl-tRNA hydrolase
MWCIAGLGNPGTQYADTRHNVGFMLTDLLSERFPVSSQQTTSSYRIQQTTIREHAAVLIQPLTYMNLSGLAIAEVLDTYTESPGQLIVIYDDLDLPLGTLRIRPRGGHGGHNGVKSIIENLDTNAFIRIRIGIGHPRAGTEQDINDSHGRKDIVDYVLHAFQQDEIGPLREVLQQAVEAIELIVTGQIEKAMNLYNRR